MNKVGLYKNMRVASPNVVIDIGLILKGIKEGQWKEQVERYRSTKKASIKESLPCYTAGGIWGSSKAISNIVSPSNLISLDIDDFKGDHQELLSYLKPISSSVYHISKSCGESGYCVLVAHKDYTDYEHYKKIYHALYTELEETGLTKVSKFDHLQNLNRLRFVSYDPEAITYEANLTQYQKELEPPHKVEIFEKNELVNKFDIGGGLSDDEKFEEVLSKYIEYSGDFGARGTRHDWILGIARWSCRADINQGWLESHLLSNYQNSSRPQVWRSEVIKCIKSSYNSYSAERGTFEITKKFSYADILASSNVEEVKQQVYLLIADKLNYGEYLVSNNKSDKFVRQEVQFLKKVVDYL